MSLDYEHFGLLCKDLRHKMHLTQIDVEKAIGISRESLRILENGLRPLSVDLINRLSYLYKIDLLKVLAHTRSSNDIFSHVLIKQSSGLLQERSFSTFRTNITHLMKELELESKKNASKGYSEYLKYLESFKDMSVEFRDRPKNKQNLELLLLYLSRDRTRCLGDNVLLDLEIVCGTVLSILYRVDDEFDKSLDILNRSKKYLLSLEEMTSSQYFLLGGIYVNEFYVYHRLNQYQRVVEGIQNLLINHKFLLPTYVYKDLLLRQGVAYFRLNQLDLAKALFLSVLVNENPTRKAQYSDILEKRYGLTFADILNNA